ncbi:MAG: nitroreductase [Nocardioidaceae bacterium]|nr:nitroreductase [Nocardioidaceae bacterium]
MGDSNSPDDVHSEDQESRLLTAYEVLTTTRSVRRRLDLVRPVPRNLIEECVEIALQAPNAVNAQRLDWIIVDDPAKRAEVADIFRMSQNDWILSAQDADRVEELDVERQEGIPEVSPEMVAKAMSIMPPAMSVSVNYLREHLHEVPVLVLPVLQGRPDGANIIGQAGFWGSIQPAIWNFLLALRTKGLGSAWTSMHLAREEEMAALLGIPYDQFTQAGLFPVAYTLGNTFKKAKRPPSEIHWNGW